LLTDKQPDVVCLCETWLSDKYVPKFSNYMAEWRHRGAAGGGLGVLMHRNMQYRVVNIPNFVGGILETQVIELPYYWRFQRPFSSSGLLCEVLQSYRENT